MMLADLLLLLIIGYILYKFVYGFLLPVMRASRHVREQFRNMQGTQGTADFHAPRQEAAPQRPAAPQRHDAKPPAGDYIDFEEIK